MPGNAATTAVHAQLAGHVIDPIDLSSADEDWRMQVEPAIYQVNEDQPVSGHMLDHLASSSRNCTTRVR